MASVKCLKCGNSIELDASMIGVPLKCPVCAFEFSIDSATMQRLQNAAGPTVNPAPAVNPAPTVNPGMNMGNMYLVQQGHGLFSTDRDYNTVFQFVMQAFQQAGVSIQTSNPAGGLIVGKAPCGLNAFGMTVRCNFSNFGNQITFQITAMFTDAFDTLGNARAKVQEISDLILRQSSVLQNAPVNTQMLMLPQYRAANDYTNLANIGRIFSILGLFIPYVTAVVGLIISIVVLCVANGECNNEARRIATIGLIISLSSIVLYALLWDAFWSNIWVWW